MTTAPTHCLILVLAGHSGEKPVHEELPAIALGDGSYTLLASPGLALNLARGDRVRIDEPDRPATVLERGGNFCIQMYADAIPESLVAQLHESVSEQLGGSVDGATAANITLAVPASNGTEAINRFFDAFKRQTGIAWYYSNIHANPDDLEDETLLDWWHAHEPGRRDH